MDTHAHLMMDAALLAQQTPQSSAAKALKGLNIAREYMRYGFTTLRDMNIRPCFLHTADVEGCEAVTAPIVGAANTGASD